ncbi:MAG: hypothetical protein NTX06_00645, partial [Proteobacteria bacterium]|nr:hypothetical protein [Pseudomonadota bacterium]
MYNLHSFLYSPFYLVLFDTGFSIFRKFFFKILFVLSTISDSVLPRENTAPYPFKVFVEHQHPLLISIPQPVVHAALAETSPAFTASALAHLGLHRKRKQREQNAEHQKHGYNYCLSSPARDHGAG